MYAPKRVCPVSRMIRRMVGGREHMWWEMIPRWPIGMLAHYASLRRRTQRLLVLGLAGALAITLLIGVAASVITGAFAAPTNLVPPGATCAQLARADQTATNGPT